MRNRTTTLLRTEVVHNRWLQGAALAVALFIVYWLTRADASPFNQYVLLADSFLHGRLHLVNPPVHLELARYGDEAFVIDPPAPALLLMPFVAIWGTGINQVLVSMAVGSAAMGFFWVAARQMGWDLRVTAAITLLLALGTNFWWAATDGGLWTFAHVSAVLFLMAALVEATGNKRPWLVGLLVGLAGMSRLPTFLTFPLFAYLLLDAEERPWKEVVQDRANWLRLGLFAVGLGVMGAAYLAYNYGRYGTLIDKGYDHPSYANEPWFAQGRFDISYIPRHIEAIFFKPPVLTENDFPYFRPSSFGLALFFSTPAFLYAFNTYFNRLTLAAIAATLLTLVPLTLHGTTGWGQFGYRFSMDLFPMLALLTAAGMRHQMTPLKWTIILFSCLIGLWGTLAFHKYGWVV
ncbi:MAG: hypothetical protein E3J81_00760 [Dehalococcoidia bacterium]|nr:MAG: hypothetical protein E3J81_00760 [Dehalococcoidia bacterium]